MTDDAKRGRGRPSKFTDEQIQKVRRLYLAGVKKAHIAKMTGISERHVRTILQGQVRLRSIPLPKELLPFGENAEICDVWRALEAARLALTPEQRARFDAPTPTPPPAPSPTPAPAPPTPTPPPVRRV